MKRAHPEPRTVVNVLAIVGSLRRGGSTATATDLLAAEVRRLASADDLEVRWNTVSLSDIRVETCLGCRACFDRGEDHCPRRDDLLALRDRILASEGVVLATPVYVNDVSGSMKTLVDRLAFVCHRPAFAGIGFCLVATTGSSPARHAIRTLETAVLTWGGAIAARRGLLAGARMARDEMEQAHSPAIARSARRFWRHLRGRRAARPTFLSLMMFRIQQWSWGRQAAGTLDRRFWEGRGWLEPSRTWYLPHRAAFPKVVMARATGNVAARIFAR